MALAVPSGVPPEAAEAARSTLGGAVAAAAKLPEAVAASLLSAAREAFTVGFQRAAWISAVVCAGLAVLVWRLLPDETADEESGEGRADEGVRKASSGA